MGFGLRTLGVSAGSSFIGGLIGVAVPVSQEWQHCPHARYAWSGFAAWCGRREIARGFFRHLPADKEGASSWGRTLYVETLLTWFPRPPIAHQGPLETIARERDGLVDSECVWGSQQKTLANHCPSMENRVDSMGKLLLVIQARGPYSPQRKVPIAYFQRGLIGALRGVNGEW